jgi:UPF0716 protein FxsA
MLALLLVLFIVVPIVELWVILQVGQAIGVLPTIGILVLDSILGSALLRSQGRGAWRRFNDALAAGRPPAREVLDGALIIFGGAFLITPGFITDVVGLLLLLPPTRAVVRRMLVTQFSRRFLIGLAGTRAARRAARGGGRPDAAAPSHQPYDYEGSAVDVDPPHLPR